MWPGLIQWPVGGVGGGVGGLENDSNYPVINNSRGSRDANRNMMNFMVLCLHEVSWTELIEVLKNSTGLGGNAGLFTQEGLRVAVCVSIKMAEAGKSGFKTVSNQRFAGFCGPDFTGEGKTLNCPSCMPQNTTCLKTSKLCDSASSDSETSLG